MVNADILHPPLHIAHATNIPEVQAPVLVMVTHKHVLALSIIDEICI